MAKARKRPPRKRVPGNRVRDPIPVAPLRDKVSELMAEGLTISDVARQLGWVNGTQPDTSRLQRRLGLKPDSKNIKTLKDGTRKTYSQEPHGFINYDRAVELCRALGCDPVDIRDPETGEPIL